MKTTQVLDTTITRIVTGLIDKEFTFVAAGFKASQFQESLKLFDERRLWLAGKGFTLFTGGADMPEFAKAITKNVIGFGTEAVEDDDLISLRNLMHERFPVCAIGFSRLYGPRFAAIVDGDNLSMAGLAETVQKFQEINLRMMPLGGRLTLKLLGKSICGLNGSAATGSMFVVSSRTKQANQLRTWAGDMPLQNDTIINQLKERFTRWQFWAKAAFGMIEYQAHQLRQEVVVVDATSGETTSTVSPRIPFEFGFSLSDIASVPEQKDVMYR